MLSKDMETLAEQVSTLSVGQRAWFWFCPGLDGLPLLLLAPFRGDPLMRKLKRRIDGTRIPAGAVPLIGLCGVGEDGVFRFAASTVSEDTLEQLADWVRQNIEAYPALRRLYGACMMVVNEKMGLVLTIEKPAFWEGIEPVVTPGTMTDTLQQIHALSPDEQAWFWATDKGPGGRPMLLALPTTDNIRALNQKVEGALRRITTRGTTIRGLITCNQSGRMTAQTQQEEKRARLVLRALGRSERHLRWMLRPRPAADDDLTTTNTALGALTPRDRGWFFQANRAKQGPLILIDADRDGLKEQMSALQLVPQQGIVGQLRVGSRSQIELAVSHPHPELLPSISRCIAQNQQRFPAFRRLIGTRMAVRAPDGSITERISSARVWAAL